MKRAACSRLRAGCAGRVGAGVLVAMVLTALVVLVASAWAWVHRSVQELRPEPHDVYIWQRAWSPALGEAMVQAADVAQRWRVLAGQVSPSGLLQPTAVDARMIAATGRPVVMVVRFDGQIAAPERGDSLVRQITALHQRWQAQGLAPQGVEIDHDCGTARLAGYADFLGRLRTALGPGVSLSITALPAWLAAPKALRQVLVQADESVLQVHAVQQPRAGLFDTDQARRWVTDYARHTPKPFRVALPTYGSRLGFDEAGNLSAVDSETPSLQVHAESRELSVSPMAVAALMQAVRSDVPPHWRGWAWFRLPTVRDERAWKLSTWRAVATGQPLAAPPVLAWRATDQPGLYDAVLENSASLDADLPLAWRAPAECAVADGVNGYRPETGVADAADAVFRRADPGLIPPRTRLVVGWVRCPTVLAHAAS